MTLTIINAAAKRGYSSWDHHITGHECENVIGQSFGSMRDLKKALTAEYHRECDERVKHVPLRATVQLATGQLVDIEA